MHISSDVVTSLGYSFEKSWGISCDGCALLIEDTINCALQRCASGVGHIVKDPNGIGISRLLDYQSAFMAIEEMHS